MMKNSAREEDLATTFEDFDLDSSVSNGRDPLRALPLVVRNRAFGAPVSYDERVGR